MPYVPHGVRAVLAGINEALTAVTSAMCWDLRDRPTEQPLRRSLRHWAFVMPRPGEPTPPPQAPAGPAVGGQSVKTAGRPVRPVLARDVLESPRRKQDGDEAVVETMRRTRKVLVHTLGYALEWGELGSNPPERTQAGRLRGPAGGRRPEPGARPAEGRLLRWRIPPGPGRGHRLVGLFGGRYYAGLRPEEAVAVAEVLPTRYAKCLYGRQPINNQLIEELLYAYDPSADPQD